MTSTVMTDWLGRGTHAARPVTPPIPAGGTAFYYETDTLATFGWTGAAWAPTQGSGPETNRFLTVPANPGFDATSIGTAITLSNANKRATPGSSSPYNYAYGLPARYTGKYYMEWVPASTSFESVGFAGGGGRVIDNGTGSPGPFGQKAQGQIGWASDGTVKTVGLGEGSLSTLSTIATWAGGNTLCMALDIDNLLFWGRVGAGNWNNSAPANPATGVGGISVPFLLAGASNGLIFPGCNMGNTSTTDMFLLSANFAQTAPVGFSPWGGA